MGKIMKLEETVAKEQAITMLLYCAPGVGKSTALGVFASKSKGRTLVLDVDRTFVNAMTKLHAKSEFDLSKVDIIQIDNINTFADWSQTIIELDEKFKEGKLEYENICVDNISELERCMLSDLGRQGKNKGIPAQGDYLTMQFKLVNSLRYMKQWEKNVYWTAWETVEQFQNPDGTSYSRLFPKVSAKIVDNICGLCDVVAKVHVTKDGIRGLILEAQQNMYAKNQIDDRVACLVDDFIGGEENAPKN